LHGTPQYIPDSPYSPSSQAAQGQQPLLVEHDRFDHLHDGRRRPRSRAEPVFKKATISAPPFRVRSTILSSFALSSSCVTGMPETVV